ncbi:hypothetical protein U9M48_023822 [Paspalum notatum var. saurae]|uniref:Uncharacterized protein n=1 Tax=Paspalum notatum var. saurae TaxID=547442 RepID=A0AAQ3WWD2_PASNO
MEEQRAVRVMNEQPMQSQKVTIQQYKAESPHYKHLLKLPSRRQMDDKQEAVHEKARTHHEDGSKKHVR